MKTLDFLSARQAMVEEQILARGVNNRLVLDAMRSVPREAFLPEGLRENAYDDNPLPIGENQTISQPFIVAFMIEALALVGGESVLEVGTGSGYAAAVLSQIAGEVYTIERVAQLAKQAEERLRSLGYRNVHVRQGDGTQGWSELAPFDAIIVAAGGPHIPDTLTSQLKIGGRMVIPIGSTPNSQKLARILRVSETAYETHNICDVCFVPLIGDEGWQKK